ncbi:hypothetical protein K492DRAFT_200052 [Lichtheimia hyalospora FSU 10163]|nr:hypothetical protein K492DRAFT_200052 [Lichtheimia hyalospora FSU 10163]
MNMSLDKTHHKGNMAMSLWIPLSFTNNYACPYRNTRHSSSIFTTALDTCITMQEVNPASALGHLYQGNIHSKQGRCLAATRVYDKAMAHVPMADTLYERIKEDESIAMKRATKWIDSIAYFPNDITFRIPIIIRSVLL